MKYTLLDMTQNILAAMSSDEVNSISDTAESLQVAQIIKNKYYDIVSRGQLPEHNQVFQLDPSLDETQPVLMYIPEGVGELSWLKYFNTNPSSGSGVFDDTSKEIGFDFTSGDSEDTAASTPSYQYVTMLPIKQFIDMVDSFNTSEANVETFSFTDTTNLFTKGAFSFNYRNDTQPKYCCVISNYFVIFDAFDNTQDSTLQSSKTMCFGQVVPKFSMMDAFIPDLDGQQFPLLLNEAKALAFYELKQQPHAMAAQEIKRQWSTVQKNKFINNRPTSFQQTPDFGRRGPYTSRPIKWS